MRIILQNPHVCLRIIGKTIGCNLAANSRYIHCKTIDSHISTTPASLLHFKPFDTTEIKTITWRKLRNMLVCHVHF